MPAARCNRPRTERSRAREWSTRVASQRERCRIRSRERAASHAAGRWSAKQEPIDRRRTGGRCIGGLSIRTASTRTEPSTDRLVSGQASAHVGTTAAGCGRSSCRACDRQRPGWRARPPSAPKACRRDRRLQARASAVPMMCASAAGAAARHAERFSPPVASDVRRRGAWCQDRHHVDSARARRGHDVATLTC